MSQKLQLRALLRRQCIALSKVFHFLLSRGEQINLRLKLVEQLVHPRAMSIVTALSFSFDLRAKIGDIFDDVVHEGVSARYDHLDIFRAI